VQQAKAVLGTKVNAKIAKVPIPKINNVFFIGFNWVLEKYI